MRRCEGATRAPEAPGGVGTSRAAVLCATSAPRTRSRLEHGDCREPLEPVGPRWEQDGNAVTPSLAGAGVLDGERAIAEQRLDPRPRASRRDPGPKVPPGHHARRGIAPLNRPIQAQLRVTFSNWNPVGFGRELSAGESPKATRGGPGEPHWFLAQAQVPLQGRLTCEHDLFHRTVEGRQQGRARANRRLGERWTSSHANSPLHVSTIEGWLAEMTETVATAQVRSA